ncbi:MAG: multicopper oxidase family protein [Cyanobacteria bacterium P01_D01_bin.50]
MRVWTAITLFLLLLLNPIPNGYAEGTNASPTNNPCGYEKIKDDADYAGKEFNNPEELSLEPKKLEGEDKESKVKYGRLTVKYGKNKIAGSDVCLRSYNGKLVGPTLRVKPGDSIEITLINDLPPEKHQEEIIRTTRTILPDGCEYEELIGGAKNEPHNFNITNFHTHGLHVDPRYCSDNVLRIMKPKQKEGDPAPQYTIKIKIPENHPSGTFWYHAHLHGSTALQVSSGMAGAIIVEGGLDDIPEIENAEEKVFVFGQIAYDENGLIEDYKKLGYNSDEKKSWWQVLKRHTTINGQIVPTIYMHPGEVQRWRFIHAGIEESINLGLRNKKTEKKIKLHEIAVDGIPLGKLDSWESIELQPGYRSDVLVEMPEGETLQEYELIDEASSAAKSVNGEEVPSILARVIVEGKLDKKMELPSDKQIAKVKGDVAPRNISDNEVIGEQKQNVVFGMISDQFMINGKSFKPENKRILKLNNAQIWKLSSQSDNHPFHIHVNPFQYDRIDPEGKDERIWRDTLMVTQAHPEYIRSRYELFSGKFVLHCHILEHEDKGMMQIVEIVDQPTL